jgi:hypothetical protein
MIRHDAVISFLDKFVPAVEEGDPKKKSLSQSRARALVVVLGMSIVIPFISLLALLILHLLTSRDFTMGMGLSLAAAVVVVIQHMLFQSTGKLFVTAVAYTATYYLGVLSAVFFTGGIESPVMLLLFCSPVITYMVSGYRYAIYAVVVGFFSAVMFVYMDLNGIQSPQMIQAANRPYIHGLVWLMASLLLFLLLVVQRGLLGKR